MIYTIFAYLPDDALCTDPRLTPSRRLVVNYSGYLVLHLLDLYLNVQLNCESRVVARFDLIWSTSLGINDFYSILTVGIFKYFAACVSSYHNNNCTRSDPCSYFFHFLSFLPLHLPKLLCIHNPSNDQLLTIYYRNIYNAKIFYYLKFSVSMLVNVVYQ